jgi:hypothetical protein
MVYAKDIKGMKETFPKLPDEDEEKDLELYEVICKNPGLSILDYEKLTGWDFENVREVIKRLKAADLVRTKAGKLMLTYPVVWRELYALSKA